MVPETETEERVAVATVTEKSGKTASSALLAFEVTPSPAKPRFSLIEEIPDNSSTTTASEDTSNKALIPEPTLSQTLTRLSTLLAAHPSPSVPHRLLTPLLPALWALTIFSLTTSRSTWHTRALSLLHTHIKTSTSPSAVLTALHDHILTAGGATWRFAPGADGGVEVRPGLADVRVDEVEVRVGAFVEVLSQAPEDAIAEFFLGVLRAWLADVGAAVEGVEAAMGMVARTAVLREVVGRGDRRRRFVGEEEDEESDDEELGEESSRAQTVTLALSLLSVLVSSPDTKLAPSDERLLQTLHPALTFLTTAPNIPEDISAFALNILSLLTLNTPTTTAPTSLAQQQKESYALALSYLRDPLIPVRAHGLHLLRELILAAAPVVDVQATMALLLGMLKDADSYVYLNVVKCLTALADRHSRTVTSMLVAAYVDTDEKLGLDERLRIGEALLNTVQRLGGALVGDVAATLPSGMVSVVSRRKTRSKKQQGEAEFGSDDEDGDQDMEEEGDVRIRASALSILGVAIETNAAGLGARVLDEALDVALLVLTLEGGVEAGILRRAAVVCVGGVLKALVGQGEEEGEVWREEVWRVVRGRVGEVRRVLGYVCGADNDGLVREQAGVVSGNLEAVVERWVVGAGRG
ncbi:hypothetical protein P167DRAFT_484733 [Morchella conica CCBAS932]|uniref:Uncharacterized protein n=1 Tax=Morchella conica CCBAS932 TaxID=1392247 RepID=A0A3N4KV17_9PEZI|nr:hypothetical protein P167DRAFT_484733 [Morchella conica CCBAS932]